MPNEKISQLTNGNPAQASDAIPTDRVDISGINVSVTAGSIASLAAVSVDNQSASYIAALSDNNNLVTMNTVGASTFTVPTNLSVPFPVGALLTISQIGAGQVTLTPASGAVTIHTPATLTTRVQYSTVSLAQIAPNVWLAAGDLT